MCGCPQLHTSARAVLSCLEAASVTIHRAESTAEAASAAQLEAEEAARNRRPELDAAAIDAEKRAHECKLALEAAEEALREAQRRRDEAVQAATTSEKNAKEAASELAGWEDTKEVGLCSFMSHCVPHPHLLTPSVRGVEFAATQGAVRAHPSTAKARERGARYKSVGAALLRR